MIKHIFTDMDGTLLDTRGSLSDTNRWSVCLSDIPVTLVSARSPIEMGPTLNKLQLKTPQIAFNGNLTFTQNDFGIQVLEKHTLPADIVSTLLDYFSTNFPNVSLSWYSLAHWYIKKQDKGVFFQKTLTGAEPRIKAFDGQSEIYKIMLMTFNPEEMLQIEQALKELDISNIHVTRSTAHTLEITSAEKTKADAAQAILEEKEIDFEEIAAIGDGHNDIPLLKVAGLPIAVDNASEEVKAHVKIVVAKNTDHGVTEALSAIREINEQVTL
ncbi:Cof-type HAD-IIB family hydrolase [Lactococcus garvieae]|jgi:HAD-superfamily hydrolase, subfamily IIB|uniref:Cof-type HAD-IIB family hydrolase n=1 Tax=Lactococcus garvieae TaxID=1363 RepID=UPI00324E1821